MNDNDEMKPANDNRLLTGKLLLLAVTMFGFGFMLVPLYDVFCEITGFGGRTNTVAENRAENPDYTRSIRVEFVTTVNEYAPWEFAEGRAGRPERRAHQRVRALPEDRVFLFHEPGVPGERGARHAAAVHRRSGPARLRGHDHPAIYFL
jgi:hypothetical protein